MTEELPMKVWTFFYGSYMNLDVLREVQLRPQAVEVATLPGYDIRIAPLANLVASDGHIVYGILATASHDELRRLYRHAEHVLGGIYLPQAVLPRSVHGSFRPALCYIAPDLPHRQAETAYVQRILTAARHFSFPEWYVQRLSSFLPHNQS
jgi:hypothetical protein